MTLTGWGGVGIPKGASWCRGVGGLVPGLVSRRGWRIGGGAADRGVLSRNPKVPKIPPQDAFGENLSKIKLLLLLGRENQNYKK